MKHYYFLLTALLAVMQMSAQTSDTVKVIDQPSQVIITETPTGVQMKVLGSNKDDNYTYTVQHSSNDTIHTTQGNDWELNFPYSLTFTKDSDSHWAITTNGFYIGGGIQHSWDLINNSFEVGLLNIASLNYDTHHGQDISLGVGIHHKSFSMKRPNMLWCEDNTGIVGATLYPNELDVKDRSSNLNVWAWQFPLMFRQRIYKKTAIRVGGIMNWNFKAQVHNRFKEGNTNYDITQKGLKQNKITFDLMAGLIVSHTGIYFRYSPNELFKKGYGPEIKNTWTLGACLAF
ncbi:MAG: hypothetical protein IKZ92_04350 [Muribaculaceae bacterium]|nr:hypothetical protein [Muribaculaceae bacterium]